MIGQPMGFNLGEARRREAAAQARRDRYKVDDETRAQRVALLEEREALLNAADAQAKAEQEARPTALQAVLQRATLDELSELARVVGQMDGRRMAEFVADALRQRQRKGYRPEDPAVPAPQALQEIPPATKVSSPRRSSRKA